MLDLERQAASFGAIEEAGGLPWIIELYGSGISLRKIAAEIPLPRWWLHVYLHDPDHPERQQALWNARKAGAAGIVEEALELADKLSDKTFLASEDVSAAKLQVETRKWMAGKQDPETYGEKQASAGIVLNVAELHLRAVREPRRESVTVASSDSELSGVGIEDAQLVVESGSDTVASPLRDHIRPAACVEVTHSDVSTHSHPKRQLDLLDALTE